MYNFEPKDPKKYTANFDVFYSGFSGIYDFLIRHTSLWHTWVGPAVPHIRGPRVLEISFGTGWLITQFASRFETYGVDLNEQMIKVTSRNLLTTGIKIPLQRASVEALPFRSETFDTVVNTMAFSGYPRADRAISEIHRVLKPGARLVLIDIGFPEDGNWIGTALARFIVATGDILRDMDKIFSQHGFTYEHEILGGAGLIHMYVAQKK